MVNEAERADWSGPSGQSWVRRQADLDQLFTSVSGLILDRAALPAGARVLDVGCGSGATALDAARAVGPVGRVLGVDISQPLLALARVRAEEADLRVVAFEEADAQVDAIAGAPFDAMVSRFGVMFFGDPVAAFANIARHLVPGAGLTFAAWADVTSNPWFALPMRVSQEILGPLPLSDPDAPGPAAFRDADRVLGILARAGLRDAAGDLVALDLQHHGGPAALAALSVEIGPASRAIRLAAGSDAKRAAIRDGIEAALAPYASPDGIRIPAGIMLYSART